MRYLSGKEANDAEKFCNIAANIATNSKCKRSKHGAVIVRDGEILGMGWNTPVPNNTECDPCRMECGSQNKSRFELCNAIYAEHNAILDALKNSHELKGSRMYHAKLKDGRIKPDYTPKCTPCSRLIMHVGISEFILLHGDKYSLYTAKEFNNSSYEYNER